VQEQPGDGERYMQTDTLGTTQQHGGVRPSLPAWFLAHGSPMLAIQDTAFTRALSRLRTGMPDPSAILVVSAHWQTRGGVRVTSSPRPETVHDFGGFDPTLYSISYPVSGDPTLASEVARLTAAVGIEARLDAARGLDHGAWVPLRWAFPDASVPVVQLSLPLPASPADLLHLGRGLAPLRRRGVLLVGSGGVVHNLRTVRLEEDEPPTPDWAQAFDAWVRDRLAELDIEALADYKGRAPHAALAVPTPEHLEPLFVVLGAAEAQDRVVTVFEGFQHGSLSLRSIALTAA
jgi:4,5-DOPA dioxygenase extradiol